ncbi:hypothetical protein EON66_11270, partial [archaeon]
MCRKPQPVRLRRAMRRKGGGMGGGTNIEHTTAPPRFVCVCDWTSALRCTALRCTALRCTALHCAVRTCCSQGRCLLCAVQTPLCCALRFPRTPPASHSMAYVDRGGGRESKNHERRVKRGLLAKANPFEKKDVAAALALSTSPEAPGITGHHVPTSIIDCGCNIISRQLARDQGRMLQRAAAEHVDAAITFVTDFERLKEVTTLVKAHPGFLYAAYGIHPDNVKRNNDKTASSKMLELKVAALSPECVAIFAGLDFSRDIASQYPQQRLLQDQLQLAAEIE